MAYNQIRFRLEIQEQQMDSKGQVSCQRISWPRSKERHFQPGYERIVGETYPHPGVTTGTQLVLDRYQGHILQVPQRTPYACHFPKEYLVLFGDQDPNCRNEDFCCLEYFQDSVMQHFFGAIISQEHLSSRILIGALHDLL